jgi:hypothetical protein
MGGMSMMNRDPFAGFGGMSMNMGGGMGGFHDNDDFFSSGFGGGGGGF